jgi:hypothetical protein
MARNKVFIMVLQARKRRRRRRRRNGEGGFAELVLMDVCLHWEYRGL